MAGGKRMMNICRQLTAAVCTALLAGGAAAQSLQERFDRAQSAYEAKEWSRAAADFEAVLEGMSERQRQSDAGASVLSRLGEARSALGQDNEALARLEEADTLFRAGGDVSAEAPVTAYLLGSLLERSGQLSAAAQQFERAVSLEPDAGPLSPARISAARVQIFADPERSRELFAAAIAAAEAAAEEDESAEDTLTDLYLLRGRVALNHADPAHAEDLYEAALKFTGRRNLKVSTRDAWVRSEAAYAKFLQGQDNRARIDLAYSGANRTNDAPSVPTYLSLPECAPLSPVRREDFMVLDLSVREDGAIGAVTPIYSTRPGHIEEPFIRAMLQSSWNAEDLQDVAPFWRSSIRVQVRCSEDREQLDWAAPILAPVRQRAGEMADAAAGTSDSATARAARAAITSIERAEGKESPKLIAPLIALWETRTLPPEAGDVLRAWAVANAERADWPLTEQAALWTMFAHPEVGEQAFDSWRERLSGLAGERARQVRTLLTVRAASMRELGGEPEDAERRYRQALQGGPEPGSLPAQFVNLRLASLAAARDAFEEADARLAESGLAPAQCALLDLSPVVERADFSSKDYPAELLRLGYRGAVSVNYDVTTEGKPADPRVTYAFPPFLWNDSVLKMTNRLRYQPIYRQGVATGCSGVSQSFRFTVSE